MTHSSVGIRGIGIFLPTDVRTNDYWSPSTIESWNEKPNLVRPGLGKADAQTEGARRTLAAMASFRDDPFKGAVERRIMAEGANSSDMELAACRDAISRSGVLVEDINLLLVFSQLPDFLLVPNAALLHKALGLPRACFAMDTQAACNSFMAQFALAEQMIKSGQAKNALLVQSSSVSRLCRPEDHHAVWFGDAATAVVVGPVSEGKGSLAWSHRVDGSFHKALMVGAPDKQWWDADRLVVYNHDRQAARNMLLLIADLAKEVVDDALGKAELGPLDVDFYATHQSTLWFRQVTQDYMGLSNAKSFDSFSWTGSLAASNIPFMLGMAEREGVLRNGQLVATYSGGSGITWSGNVLRWGH